MKKLFVLLFLLYTAMVPLIAQEITWTEINVTALDYGSAVQKAIGADNLESIENLKISGTINSYDFNILRNKMPILHHLDLENVNIIANDYKYYSNYSSKDNELGSFVLSNKSSLISVKLPRTITTIGQGAFRSCSNLEEVTLFRGILEIQEYAFEFCYSLREIVLPPTIQRLSAYAFHNCHALSEIRIPSSMKSIVWYTFDGCPISDVYTYTIEPTYLDSNVFSFSATLHVPSTSFNNYYWASGWNQFSTMVAFDEPYEYFYLNNDYTLDDNTGRIDGEPDADLNPGSGLIVEGGEDQDLDDVHVIDDGASSGSIIGDVSVNDLYCNISIMANRWYFFSFPFDVSLRDNISYDGNCVWHEYDGAARANNGKGWKKLGSKAVLKAGKGYIFQGNKSGTLTVEVKKPDLQSQDKAQALNTHAAINEQDASWNFVGNPYLSYFDIEDLEDFDAPITVWNGSSYEAIRPGDDDYHFQPYQAFFVQKPKDIASLTFVKEGQETYHQSQATLAAAKARRANAAKDTNRKIVNLTVSDGENTDKTRVVLNESKSRAYEMDCDASKFFSQERVPQIYTIDGDVNYAINERPVENGTISLGFKANKEGEFTLSAPRMDARCLLKDNVTGSLIDLQDGDYIFSSKQGTYLDRFILIVAEKATGIRDAEADLAGNKNTMYDLSGRKITSYRGGDGEGLQKGVMIKDGHKVIVK